MSQAALASSLRAVPVFPAAPDSSQRPPEPLARATLRGAARRRRGWLRLSFALVVLLPAVAAATYLFGWAQDQYHSRVAFSVRSESGPVPIELGLLAAVGGAAQAQAPDSDILFDYIISEAMVAAIDQDLDLTRIFHPFEGDPVFTLAPDASREDKVDYWQRMVRVRRDAATGVLDVEVRAFRPEDAQALTAAIYRESDALVNRLSEQAREDAIRYATADLAEAETRLRDKRRLLAEFRDSNRIVDPEADIEGQMGLLNALQSELVQTLVERDMLLTYAKADDQRVAQANRRADAVSNRIEAEREKLGLEGDTRAMAALLGRYEELRTDLEFAAGAYTQALAGHAAALAEARRKARYLAAHVLPTLPESAIYPRRTLLSGLVVLALTLAWAIGAVLCYNIRDAR
ncbi:sugar transporter [Defluviimonas sp. WL0002]|uniref:Sugar transporter n=1 Tax=Albidovulum marisflavi TaxID=2984159 RepID=A0ABT2ZGB7_9RHOB|nr:sugar transporter [Defluviimonas sp. WL0002]MCV2870156.1 sugar transporter [Defluviimonas sp. WL0002]